MNINEFLTHFKPVLTENPNFTGEEGNGYRFTSDVQAYSGPYESKQKAVYNINTAFTDSDGTWVPRGFKFLVIDSENTVSMYVVTNTDGTATNDGCKLITSVGASQDIDTEAIEALIEEKLGTINSNVDSLNNTVSSFDSRISTAEITATSAATTAARASGDVQSAQQNANTALSAAANALGRADDAANSASAAELSAMQAADKLSEIRDSVVDLGEHGDALVYLDVKKLNISDVVNVFGSDEDKAVSQAFFTGLLEDRPAIMVYEKSEWESDEIQGSLTEGRLYAVLEEEED